MNKAARTTATVFLAVLAAGTLASPASASNTNSSLGAVIENTGNHILTAYANGEIEKGTSLEELKLAVPEAFTAPAGTNMAIVYNEEAPTQFSICGWGTGKDGKMGESLSSAMAYKSVPGTFSPMAIDCTFDNIEQMDLVAGDSVAAIRPDASKLDFDTVTPSANRPAQTVENAPVPVPAQQEEPSEPVEMPWGVIGFIGAILGILAVGFGVVAGFINFAKKNSRSRQTAKVNIQRWADAMDRHETIRSTWTAYELDPVKILDFPLLSDMREGVTQKFHSALRKANSLRPAQAKDVSTVDAISSPYAKAVGDLEDAFNIAETEAKRIRWSHFSNDERRRLQKAKDLLNLAMDTGASEHERQAAYKRMRKELDGLIVVPKSTILTIEKKINLAITDGSETVV